jgi:hypothetical protein
MCDMYFTKQVSGLHKPFTSDLSSIIVFTAIDKVINSHLNLSPLILN